MLGVCYFETVTIRKYKMPSHLNPSLKLVSASVRQTRPPITSFRVLSRGKLFLEMKWTIQSGWRHTTHPSLRQSSSVHLPLSKTTGRDSHLSENKLLDCTAHTPDIDRYLLPPLLQATTRNTAKPKKRLKTVRRSRKKGRFGQMWRQHQLSIM